MRDPRSVLITGASSGIGAALAEAYAAPSMTLSLMGRDRQRLAAVAERCRNAGAGVRPVNIDVTDKAATADAIAEADAAAPLDLVIANAGISGGTSGNGEAEGQARLIFSVNLDGVLNTVHPAIAALRRRGRGQIGLMSSLAAFRGFAGAPAYCASKAAVRVYGEALRGALRTDGIAVSVICPGFVRSPMTAVNDFPMPFLIDAPRAARIIKRGLARDRARIAFPWQTYLGAWLAATLPPALVDRLVRRLPSKPALGVDDP